MGIGKRCVGLLSLTPIALMAALAQEPSLEERILEGQRLEAQGDAQRAERVFRDVLRTVEQEGLGLAATAAVLDNLASVNMDRGNYMEAERLFQTALAAAGKATGAGSTQTVNVLTHLAGMYLEIGRPEEAVPLMRRVQSIVAAEKIPHSVSAAMCLFDLGAIYIALRSPDKAVPVLGQALDIFEKQPGPRDSRIVQTLASRAVAYAEMGRTAAAIADLERAEAALGSLPEAQPHDWLLMQNSAGLVYARAKQPAKAEDRFHRALELAESLFGSGHPMVASVLRNCAAAMRIAGRRKEAKDLDRRADAILALNRTANPVGLKVNRGMLSLWQPSAPQPVRHVEEGEDRSHPPRF